MEVKKSSAVEGINRFGFELLEQIAKKANFEDIVASNNVFISPFSIALCFAMVLEGADGETKEQLLNVFHLNENYLTQLQPAIALAGKVLKTATSIWVHNSVNLAEDYIKVIKDNILNSEAHSVDFNDEQTFALINRWIKEKAAGLIDGVEIPRDSKLALVNAVVFKRKWETTFDQSFSQSLEFKSFAAKLSTIFMINMKGRFAFHQGSNFKAICFPYETDGPKYPVNEYGEYHENVPFVDESVSMVVVLPKQPMSANWSKICCAEFLRDFVANTLPYMTTKSVEVYMPKFQYDAEYNLKEHMHLMGATNLWEAGSANLSKMTNGPNGLFGTSASHKTYITVNEHGTKAAASTVLTAGYGDAGDEEEPEVFKADNPFVYFIYHHGTKQVLFVGYVVKPGTRTFVKES